MESHIMSQEMLEDYRNYLVCEEKSPATVEKYMRDVKTFYETLEGGKLDKGTLIRYREALLTNHTARSVNSMLISVRGFLKYMGWEECQIRLLRVQKSLFCDSDKILTREEYMRLLKAAEKKKNKRLYYILQTLCATGIRVSELRYITVSAVVRGRAQIRCKGKLREILIPGKLCSRLLVYAKASKIHGGSLFITQKGNPIDRSNLWKEMKGLCREAEVKEGKVFPHNLRHLFARTYYKKEKDISGLADILGHSSVDTTRIYMIDTGQAKRGRLDRLGLVV